MPWKSPGELRGIIPSSTLRDQFSRGTRKRRVSPDSTGYQYWVEDDEIPQAPLPVETGSAIQAGTALERLAEMAATRKPKETKKPSSSRSIPHQYKMAVIIGDTHLPVHHEAFWNATLDFIEDVRPDKFIANGDIADCEAASSHGGNPSPPKLADEMEQVNDLMDQLDQVIHTGCEKVFNLGNHETRLNRTITRLMPALYGAVMIEDILRLVDRGYKVNQHMEPEMCGKLAVVHGDWCPKNYTGKYMRDYGAPSGGGVVIGHTHRPQMATKKDRGGYRLVAGLGHGADEEKATYLNRNPSDWVMGLGVCYYDEITGDWQLYPIMAPDGHFIWNGKRYG